MESTGKKSKFLYRMLLIRRFEEMLLGFFEKGLLHGTTHTYLGQEAIAVAALDAIQEEDHVISNHRCHGHFIAYTGLVEPLLAEILGLLSGPCHGRGGSQHVHFKNFYSNGVLGNMIPVGVGIAYGSKLDRSPGITVIFLGDGALGEGVVYEALNLASLLKAPCLFIVENNQFAQTTPIAMNLSGTIPERFKAFGIPTRELSSNDVEILHPELERAVAETRETRSPHAVVIHTYRMGPHSKGDDPRPREELDRRREFDPIRILSARMSASEIDDCEKRVQRELAAACVNLGVEHAVR